MKNIFLFSLCFLGLVSCSSLNIAVRWADTYIVSSVDDYFELSSQQSTELKSAVQADVRKVRRDFFPKVADTLRDIEKEVSKDDINQEKVGKYFSDVNAMWWNMAPFLSDTSVEFIATATPKQLDHFEEFLRKKNQKDQEKIQDREQTRKEDRKKHLRWLEMCVNSLTKEQDKLLNDHISNNPFPRELQLKNKESTLQKFHEARKDTETLKSFVRDFYQKHQEIRLPEYQTAIADYQKGLQKFIFQFLQSLTPSQKKEFRENLLNKASELERLSKV